jgi:DNA mismatch endonuclease, patch repair protein
MSESETGPQGIPLSGVSATSESPSAPPKCACGCGGLVRPGRRFLHGHFVRTEAARQRLREVNLAKSDELSRRAILWRKDHPDHRRPSSPVTNAKIASAIRGRHMSDAAREKLSATRLGKPSPLKGRVSPLKGRTLPRSTIENMRRASAKRTSWPKRGPMPQQTKLRLSIANRGRPPHTAFKDTAPELLVQSALLECGVPFVKHPVLPDGIVPDLLVLPDLAVFVHGCYWHGCPTHGKPHPLVEKRRRRDQEVADWFRGHPEWGYVVVWEHSTVDMRTRKNKHPVRSSPMDLVRLVLEEGQREQHPDQGEQEVVDRPPPLPVELPVPVESHDGVERR